MGVQAETHYTVFLPSPSPGHQSGRDEGVPHSPGHVHGCAVGVLQQVGVQAETHYTVFLPSPSPDHQPGLIESAPQSPDHVIGCAVGVLHQVEVQAEPLNTVLPTLLYSAGYQSGDDHGVPNKSMISPVSRITSSPSPHHSSLPTFSLQQAFLGLGQIHLAFQRNTICIPRLLSHSSSTPPFPFPACLWRSKLDTDMVHLGTLH